VGSNPRTVGRCKSSKVMGTQETRQCCCNKRWLDGRAVSVPTSVGVRRTCFTGTYRVPVPLPQGCVDSMESNGDGHNPQTLDVGRQRVVHGDQQLLQAFRGPCFLRAHGTDLVVGRHPNVQTCRCHGTKPWFTRCCVPAGRNDSVDGRQSFVGVVLPPTVV
jgi:hypothetical protein